MKKKMLKSQRLYVLLLLPALLFAVLLFAVTKPNIAAQAQSNPPSQTSMISTIPLSEMPDNDLIDFVLQSGIDIPYDLSVSTDFISSVRSVIQASHRSVFSYYLTQDLINNIQALIDDDQGVVRGTMQESSSTSSVTSTPNILENNLVKDEHGNWVDNGGYWDPDYENYNCYSFAIGETTDRGRYPGQHSDIDLYTYSDYLYYFSNYSIEDMANFVKNDLMALGGYGDVYVSSTEPTVQSCQTLICIRKGDGDYHFMKFDPISGYWEHKPGGTTPLRYLHHPEDIIWVTEYSSYGASYNNDDLMAMNGFNDIYDSPVYYITYGEAVEFIVISGTNVSIKAKQGVSLSGALVIPKTTVIGGVTHTVTQIAANGFANQILCTEITIPSSVTAIGVSAFSGCTNLTTVYVDRPSSSGITTLGSNAFGGQLSAIYVPDVASAEAYKNDANWSAYQSVIAPREYTVTFDKQEGRGGSDYVDAVICGAAMPPASAPTRSGYAFDGYYSQPNGGGTQYYDEDMDSVNNYDVIGNTTLYAKWILVGVVTYSDFDDYTVYNFYADSQNEGVIILDFRGQNVIGSEFIFHDLRSVKFIGDEYDGWNDIQNYIQITVFNPYNYENMSMSMHFENFRFMSFDYYAFYIFGDNIMITAEGDCLIEGADGFPALFIYARDITFYADIEEATFTIRGGNGGGGYPYISYLDEYSFNILFEGTGLFLETVSSSMSAPEGSEDFESFCRQIAEQIIADNIASGKWPPILETLLNIRR